MDESTKRNIIDLIQDKTALALLALPNGQAVALKRRLNQMEGMIEVIHYLPEYQGLIEPLQQHYDWLKQKRRSWPI